MSISYTQLPAALRPAAVAYVEHGQEPPALLLHVLDNNLFGALDCMPHEFGAAELWQVARWAQSEAPVVSRGNPQATDAWMQSGGLKGRAAARLAANAMARASATSAAPVFTQDAPAAAPAPAAPPAADKSHFINNLVNLFRQRTGS